MFKLRMVMEGRLLIHDGTSARQYHALIAIIHSSDSNMIHKEKSTSSQCFPKSSFAADVDRSKCLHATS